MTDRTAARLPDELPLHRRSAQPRLRVALGALDLSVWRFLVEQDLLVAFRRWPDVAVDTLVVIGPNTVLAHRHVPGTDRPVWEAQGNVEGMVRAISALETPKGRGDGHPDL